MVLVIKSDQHPAGVHTFVSDVWDYMTVEHPCARVGADYLDIDGLSRSYVLSVTVIGNVNGLLSSCTTLNWCPCRCMGWCR